MIFYAYDYFTGGSLSVVEKEIKLLEKEFQTAFKSAKLAHRSAAVSGLNTTTELEMAVRVAEDVKKRLIILMEKIESDSVFKKAELLKTSITNFLEKYEL